jgi:hypothetical protein
VLAVTMTELQEKMNIENSQFSSLDDKLNKYKLALEEPNKGLCMRRNEKYHQKEKNRIKNNAKDNTVKKYKGHCK